MDARPYFLWDVPVTESELRERLRHPDPRIRAQWEGRLMREAKFADVWRYLTLDDILRDWDHLVKHLGRMRGAWESLLRGWREDGLIPS